MEKQLVETSPEKLGEVLYWRRHDLRLSRADAAALAGISASRIKLIEEGSKDYFVTTLLSYMRVLRLEIHLSGVDPAVLIKKADRFIQKKKK